jgi:hypothetical protein
MDFYSGHLACLLSQSENDIYLILKKGFHAVLIPEARGNLYVRAGFLKQFHGFRQEIKRLPNHHTDGNAVLVFCAEILSLFNGAFQVLPHAGQEGNELSAGRGEGCALPVPLKDCEADFFLQEFYLIGKGRLADKRLSAARLKFSVRATSIQ